MKINEEISAKSYLRQAKAYYIQYLSINIAEMKWWRKKAEMTSYEEAAKLKEKRKWLIINLRQYVYVSNENETENKAYQHLFS